MVELTVDGGGRITLPVDMLIHLGIKPGDEITVNKMSNGIVECVAAPTDQISDLSVYSDEG